MEQPKNNMSFVDNREIVLAHGMGGSCDVFIEECDYGSFAWIAAGRTPLLAHKAAVRRLKRFLGREERAVAKLEKGGE